MNATMHSYTEHGGFNARKYLISTKKIKNKQLKTWKRWSSFLYEQKSSLCYKRSSVQLLTKTFLLFLAGLCRTLKSIFTSIDKDNSGALSKAEFEAGLNAFG